MICLVKFVFNVKIESQPLHVNLSFKEIFLLLSRNPRYTVCIYSVYSPRGWGPCRGPCPRPGARCPRRTWWGWKGTSWSCRPAAGCPPAQSCQGGSTSLCCKYTCALSKFPLCTVKISDMYCQNLCDIHRQNFRYVQSTFLK